MSFSPLTTNKIISPTQYAFPTTLELFLSTANCHQQYYQKQKRSQTNTSNIHRPFKSIRHRLARTPPTKATDRVQVRPYHHSVLQVILPKQKSISSHATRTIPHTNHHPRDPTRQHTLNHVFPPLHQQHSPNCPQLQSLYVRR